MASTENKDIHTELWIESGIVKLENNYFGNDWKICFNCRIQ